MLFVSELKVKDLEVLSHLKSFLGSTNKYHEFDENMILAIYADGDNNFLMFEAEDYEFGFSSMSEEHLEKFRGKVQMCRAPFCSLKEHIDRL